MSAEFDKSEVVVREVRVRPIRADERRRWDALMDEHHYLGFRQFAGRGVRHVSEWRGHWVALPGWQSGAFKCALRDRWLGWHRSVQFRRLHLIANNTRFPVLPEAAGVPNLASRALSRSVRRLGADWEAAHGHPVELAEGACATRRQSTPPRGRRPASGQSFRQAFHVSIHASAREATSAIGAAASPTTFQSTPSAREATGLPSVDSTMQKDTASRE